MWCGVVRYLAPSGTLRHLAQAEFINHANGGNTTTNTANTRHLCLHYFDDYSCWQTHALEVMVMQVGWSEYTSSFRSSSCYRKTITHSPYYTITPTSTQKEIRPLFTRTMACKCVYIDMHTYTHNAHNLAREGQTTIGYKRAVGARAA